jgi:hypothetical protein
MPGKLVPIAVGDTKEIGKKEYELTDEGGLVMQVAVPYSKTYNLGGLMAMKAKLEAELAEVDSLIAKHAELVAK